MEQAKPSRRRDDKFVFDKKILISVIIPLLFQSAFLVSWGSKLDSRVEDHERRIVIGETLDRDYSKTNVDVCQRIARLEEKITLQNALLERIESILSRGSTR